MVKSLWTSRYQRGRPGTWVLHAGPSLRGRGTSPGEPGGALSRGAAPALCSLDQAAAGVEGISTQQFVRRPFCPCALPGRSDCQPRSMEEGGGAQRGLSRHWGASGTGSAASPWAAE